jgi:hypothetical protein
MAIGGTRRKLETARCTIRILHLIVEDDRESESRCRQRTLEFLEEPEAKLSGNEPDRQEPWDHGRNQTGEPFLSNCTASQSRPAVGVGTRRKPGNLYRFL